MAIKDTILDNWRQVIRTYSFVFHVIAALVTLIDVVLPYMSLIEPAMDKASYGILMFALNVAGAVGRLIKQPEVSGDVIVVTK